MTITMEANTKRLIELFSQATALTSPEERRVFLAEVCNADPELGAQVESLLRAQTEAGEFLKAPVVGPPLETLTEKPGDWIGRYKLLEKIGEGGFGVVYLAEQKEPVKRRVALKIIKLGMDTMQVVVRFEAERQALALMDHPNIAKVFDAGSTEATAQSEIANRKSQIAPGRPYFVMELVRGVPITRYCDENHLSTGERLQLFLQVCQAVQHAHQKGIIHRDLKPSNILVTVNDGVAVPKVIDFGVAKATQQQLTDKTIFTQFHHFIGTPAYMSPEQAQMTSLDIDTRSDIYALGVLLYELLTGKPPFDGKELLASGLDAMRQTIREKEPMKPSKRIESELKLRVESGRARDEQTLNSQLKSLSTDLDWIVMKCLEKERARRYDTANGLAADIERHLNDEPVLARPPSAAYRFQKLVLRHKVQFAAAAFALVTLVFAAAVSTWQAVQARRERRAATEQAAIAKAIKDFLNENFLGVNVLSGAAPEPDAASFEATRVLAEKAARKLEGRFTNQPLIEAEIRMTLAIAFSGFAETPKMAAQAEKAWEIQKRLLGPTHSDTLNTVATLAVAKHFMGQRNEAENLLANALATARNAANEWSAGGAWVLYEYGRFLRNDGRPAEALPHLREAVAALRKTHDPKHPRIKQAMGDVARATQETGQTADAEALWTELVRQCERDYTPEHPSTIQAQHGLARFWVEQKRTDDAIQLLDRVIALFRQQHGINHRLTLDAEYLLGLAYEQKAQFDAAAKLYADLHPRWSQYLPRVFTVKFCFRNMAQFFARHGRYDDARAVHASLADFLTAHPPEEAGGFEILLETTASTKGWPAAAELCRQRFDRGPESISMWLNKARILRYVGDEESYRRVVTKVLAVAPTVRSLEDQRQIIEIAALGTFPFSAEQVNQLDSLIRTVEADSPGGKSNPRAWGFRAIGHLQLRLGRLSQSLAALEKSVSFQSRPDAYTLFLKAMCLHQLGRSEEVRAAFERAESVLEPKLREPQIESEGFLPAWQIHQHIVMRREMQAALASPPSAP